MISVFFPVLVMMVIGFLLSAVLCGSLIRRAAVTPKEGGALFLLLMLFGLIGIGLIVAVVQ
jgi:hypothetical protein